MQPIITPQEARRKLQGVVRPGNDKRTVRFDSSALGAMAVDLTLDEHQRLLAIHEATRARWQREEARQTLGEILRDFGVQTVQFWINRFQDEENARQFFARR